jgi:hypothetical protein
MAHICDVNTGGFSMSNTQPVNSLDIYYRNVRSLRTKQHEFYDNVWSTDQNILCSTETYITITIYFLTATQFSVLTGYVPIRRG